MAMVGRGDGRELGGDRQGDVLPALGTIVLAGAILGMLAAMGLTELVPSGRSRFAQVIFGTALGAILGLFAGMSRVVWRLGPPLGTSVPEPRREPEPASPELWDPWLDSGRDSQWIESEPLE